MRRSIHIGTWLTLVALLSLNAEARKIKVEVEVNKQADFSKFRTYAWMKHSAVARPMLAQEVVGATDQELQSLGLQNADKNPDLLINFYGGVNTLIGLAASDPTYAANGGIAPLDSTVWSAGARSFTGGIGVYVNKGTLVIEILDAHTNNVLWRATARGNLDTNSLKALEGVNKAVQRLFREYPLRKSSKR